jgi:hypothetical protein
MSVLADGRRPNWVIHVITPSQHVRFASRADIRPGGSRVSSPSSRSRSNPERPLAGILVGAARLWRRQWPPRCAVAGRFHLQARRSSARVGPAETACSLKAPARRLSCLGNSPFPIFDLNGSRMVWGGWCLVRVIRWTSAAPTTFIPNKTSLPNRLQTRTGLISTTSPSSCR